MAWPMVEWVLDNRYRHLHHQLPEADASIIVYGSAESTLTPLMVEVETRFARLKVFSLPHMGEDGTRRHIELGVRGDPEEVAAAIEALKQGVLNTGATFEIAAARGVVLAAGRPTKNPEGSRGSREREPAGEA